MKKNKLIFLGLLGVSVMLTTSCNDSFLNVENPAGEPLEEYYTTDAHIQEAVVAAYDPMHWPDWGLGQYNALNIDAEIMGDDFWVGGSNISDMQNWHKLFNYEGDANNTLGSLWTVDYSGIKRCNDVIKYLGYAAGNLTDTNKKWYEMQARTLRVFYYNMLWHYFGNIPFYLTNMEAPYKAPQLKSDDVYSQLIVELEDILKNGDLPMKMSKTADYGRVTKAFAIMMYAEMVMYQNDQSRYATALTYLQEIIGSTKYQLNPKFADIWAESGEWCDESIFEINYEESISERDWGSPLAIGGTVLPTLISPNSWSGGDGWSKGQDGWGFLPVRLETYAQYNDNDARRSATVWDLRGKDYTARYQDTHLWLAKYRPFDANNANCPTSKNLNYNNNYRYYRYAETLLDAAELSLRTGGSETGDAKTWLNDVHTRAGLGELSKATLDDVLKERHLEFIGEGKRYWDLVRTGEAAKVLTPDKYGYRTNSWTESKKYIPIAQGELDTDPALVQNKY